MNLKKGIRWAFLALAMICTVINAYAAEEARDITEEILAGPNELNPEKILGPGGIGIETGKNLLMSFGATVRIIPTFESNYDFGLTDKVPGYVETAPIKSYAGGALNTANAAQEVYQTVTALDNALENNRGIRSAFDDLTTALSGAEVALGDMVTPAADGAATLKANADAAAVLASGQTAETYITATTIAGQTKSAYQAGIEAGQAASEAYQAAIAAQDVTVAGEALQAIATNPDYQAAVAAGDTATAQALATQIATPYVLNYAMAAADAVTAGSGAALQAIVTNPAYQAAMAAGNTEEAMQAAEAAATPFITQAAIAQADATVEGGGTALQAVLNDPNYQAAVAAGNSEAAEAAAQAVIVQAAAAAGDAAASGVIADNVAPLTAGANAIAAGVAAQVTGNPTATSANINDAVAYLTALKATADSFQPYYLADTFLRTHSNESGSVNDGYIRTETKMYFNAMPRDKKWSFYAALEFDKCLDTNTIDNRGGKSADSSTFGLERLKASMEIVDGLRLNGGWDVWGLDAIYAGSMVYGDDNAGFWLNGNYDSIAFSVAWLKLEDNDFQDNPLDHLSAADNDRDLYAGYFDYKFDKDNFLRFFYGFDRIRNAPATDFLGYLANEANLGRFAGIRGGTPDTDAHTIGAFYVGDLGMLEFMVEGAYKFGSADNTGLQGVYNGVNTIQYNDFDIEAYALSADIGLEFGDKVGWQSLRPHFGFMWTSGDDDNTDDTLGGWTGITSAQRFSRQFGGENTIIGDTNFLLGTALYGYIPEMYGNGTPVFTGGLQNMSGIGVGRGDNPGLTMYSVGLNLRPVIFFIYRTNVNMFYWNEDFYVTNMVQPITLTSMLTGTKVPATKIEAGFAGTEWDNEFLLALSKHSYIKAQLSFFFPGEAVKDVTKALSGGTEADETATRFAMEFIWNF